MKPDFLTKETVLDFGVKDRKFPEFRVGDTIQISLKAVEGVKERIQLFKGDVIAFHRNGVATTFTARRLSADNVMVERILPYYSPVVTDIQVIKRGDVRRAKLFYLRDRIGKAARIKEKVTSKKKIKAKQEAKAETK